MSNKGRCLCDY